MPFANVLLFATAFYVSSIVYKLSRKYKNLSFTLLSAASFLLLAIQAAVILEDLSAQHIYTVLSAFLTEWGHLLILTLIYSSLALKIWELKPVFSRFPKACAALSFLIIPSYLLVLDTYALKEWLLFIYQGGAIFLALILYTINSKRTKSYYYVLAGIIAMFISYIGFWYVTNEQGSFQQAWEYVLALGIGLFGFGYYRVTDNVDVLEEKLELHT